MWAHAARAGSPRAHRKWGSCPRWQGTPGRARRGWIAPRRMGKKRRGLASRGPGGGLTPRAQELEGSRRSAQAGSGGSRRARLGSRRSQEGVGRTRRPEMGARAVGGGRPRARMKGGLVPRRLGRKRGASRRACPGEGWPAHAAMRMLKPHCARRKEDACLVWAGMGSRVARAGGSAGPAHAGPRGSHSAAFAGGVNGAARGRGMVDPGGAQELGARSASPEGSRARKKWGLSPRTQEAGAHTTCARGHRVQRKGLRAAGGGNSRA